MLTVPIFLWNLMVTPVADTVWWHTSGGEVTQHSEQNIVNCTLTIENDQGKFAFVWNRDLPASIMVTQQVWQFPSDETMTVAMRIGDVWLEGGNGAPNMTAMTAKSALMVIPNQPFDYLLPSADEVVVRTPDAQFGILLLREKMTPLIAALHRCRAAIGLRDDAPRG
jgi:hypothetical protein